MKIKKINKYNFNGKVYNFHCLPNENYFSEGILVHNCYKGNGGNAPVHNLSFDEFKIILDKMPPLLTQIAFGIMNISTNPDFFKMMEYSRERGIIPNYTCHGLDVTDEYAKRTSELCGAVAVSVYNKEKSYDSIKKFTDNSLKQKIYIKKINK